MKNSPTSFGRNFDFCSVNNFIISPPKLVNQSTNTERADHASDAKYRDGNTPHCCDSRGVHGLSRTDKGHIFEEVLHFLDISREGEVLKGQRVRLCFFCIRIYLIGCIDDSCVVAKLQRADDSR